ncbi:hypothetical protein SY88_17745 [Clostridiales bacterium PH28_bin88]|nr:hypothetical protein SY88_17745 [Clostridiales bacterium PH28_bin88]
MNQENSRLTYPIGKADHGLTISQVLYQRLCFSRSLIRKLRAGRKVTLNGEQVYWNRQVREGEELVIQLHEPEVNNSVIPENIPLDIAFEDQDLMVLDKPAGMLVHPSRGENTGTLANAVVSYWQGRGEQSRFRPVHRLDRNTSGLLVVAKNQFTHQHLAKSLGLKTLSRHYIAVVHGVITPNQGTIREPIARKPGSIVERMVSREGQEAITHFRVIRRFPDATLVMFHLDTGRTHQIRVHMSHLGHPLHGDTLYGGSPSLIPRQALHSSRLEFPHPRTGERMAFDCQVPPDMQKLVRYLEAL